jgi:hypothetical protein
MKKEDFDHFYLLQTIRPEKPNGFGILSATILNEFHCRPFISMTKIRFELKDKIPTGEIVGYKKKILRSLFQFAGSYYCYFSNLLVGILITKAASLDF